MQMCQLHFHDIFYVVDLNSSSMNNSNQRNCLACLSIWKSIEPNKILKHDEALYI